MSKIEWTDKTWNPVTGCTKISQGCKNCYAETFYERFNGKGSFKNVICHKDRLSIPIKWKKPSMVFVNSMSDLFHEDVPFEFIHNVFIVMGCNASHHTYQVLTKRPQRLIEYIQWFEKSGINPDWKRFSDNIWIGVSVEDQKAADERIPLLKNVPVSVRFLSCEPLLGNIMLNGYCQQNNGYDIIYNHLENIHWVIAGGESGHGARPMHPDWVRSIRDQCNTSDVPFFFKQWGEYIELGHGDFVRVGKKAAGRELDGIIYNQFPKQK